MEEISFYGYSESNISEKDIPDFKRYLEENVPDYKDPMWLTEEEFDYFFERFMVDERNLLTHAKVDDMLEAIVAVFQKSDGRVSLYQLEQEVEGFGEGDQYFKKNDMFFAWYGLSLPAQLALYTLLDNHIIQIDEHAPLNIIESYKIYLAQGYQPTAPVILLEEKGETDLPWFPIMLEAGPDFDTFEPIGWYPEKHDPLIFMADEVHVIDPDDQITSAHRSHPPTAPRPPLPIINQSKPVSEGVISSLFTKYPMLNLVLVGLMGPTIMVLDHPHLSNQIILYLCYCLLLLAFYKYPIGIRAFITISGGFITGALWIIYTNIIMSGASRSFTTDLGLAMAITSIISLSYFWIITGKNRGSSPEAT